MPKSKLLTESLGSSTDGSDIRIGRSEPTGATVEFRQVLRRAADQNLLPLTPEQRAELDRCLDTYELSGGQSRPAEDVIAEIKNKL